MELLDWVVQKYLDTDCMDCIDFGKLLRFSPLIPIKTKWKTGVLECWNVGILGKTFSFAITGMCLSVHKKFRVC